MPRRQLHLNRLSDLPDAGPAETESKLSDQFTEEEIAEIVGVSISDAFGTREIREALDAEARLAVTLAEFDAKYDPEGKGQPHAHLANFQREIPEEKPSTLPAPRDPEDIRIDGKPIVLVPRGTQQNRAEARYESLVADVTPEDIERQSITISARADQLRNMLEAENPALDEYRTIFCSKSGMILGEQAPESLGMLVQTLGLDGALEILKRQSHSHVAPHWLRTDRDSLSNLIHIDPRGTFVFLAKQISGECLMVHDSKQVCSECGAKYSQRRQRGHVVEPTHLGRLRADLDSLPEDATNLIIEANQIMFELCYLGIHRESRWPRKFNRLFLFQTRASVASLRRWIHLTRETLEYFVKKLVRDKEIDRRQVVTTNMVANFVMGDEQGKSKRGRQMFAVAGTAKKQQQMVAATLDAIFAPHRSEDPLVNELKFTARKSAIPKSGYSGTTIAHDSNKPVAFNLSGGSKSLDELQPQNALPSTGFKFNLSK